MEALSHRYGWTPDQIRDMRYDDVMNYLTVMVEESKLQKANSMKYGQ